MRETPDPDVRDGDWRCLCGDLNREHEAFCFRCGGGDPREEMPAPPFFTDQQERALARCESYDEADASPDERLREAANAVKPYALHTISCGHDKGRACSCGLSAALAALAATDREENTDA